MTFIRSSLGEPLKRSVIRYFMFMKTLLLASIIVALFATSCIAAQRQDPYAETRKLLIQMYDSGADENLKKLFEEAVSRREDLIRALNDANREVSFKAQIVIKYLAEPALLEVLNKWLDNRKRLGKDYLESVLELKSDLRYLKGDGDLAAVVVSNLYPDLKPVTAKVVANNKELSTALIEIFWGSGAFGERRLVALRREGAKWRLLSDNVVWIGN